MYCCDDPEAELREFCEGTVESSLEVKWRTRGSFDCESQRVEIRTPSEGVLLIGKRIDKTTEAVFDGKNKRICSLLRSQLLAFVSDSWNCRSYQAKWGSCKGRDSSVQVVHLGGAPILFVRKEDGPMRMYIEYRELNKFTVKNRFPLPRIDDLFDQLLGTAKSLKIDLRLGYHQVKVTSEDMQKTASKSRCGCFDDDVRITNALAMFMDLTNRVSTLMLDRSVIVFTYDTLIYSKSKGEHVKLLVEVLETLRKERLYSNVTLGYKMVQFLENFVNREGIVVDSVRVEAIAKWETSTEIRSFIGLARLQMVHPRLLGICDVFGKAYEKDCEVVGVFSVAKSRSSSCLESCATNPATGGRGKKVAVVMRVLLMRLTVTTAVLELIKSSQVDAVKEVN
ncbi:LOW QUALITY PROTEIN: hypothetical protein OSB04_024168 [Centaurea solstitialis]|uniref:Reverse transcriptase domain-containing protein n=1 Tax=Centaurea solstitialis TaxID=347529 RepID=A0AA38WDL8_9ASTR|nr:LOW QUALITY PROTEIN: hypothetical protein OSB04_024168 [Centaurea solstitialis]